MKRFTLFVWISIILICLVSLFPVGLTSRSFAQDVENGVPISTAADSQSFPDIISDGSGGAIIVWEDWRGGDPGIYTQRVDSDGIVQWFVDGVPISTTIHGQLSPAITGDGSGGAIITWLDLGGAGPDIYAQRIDTGGAMQWAPDGVPISTALNYQERPQIANDGSGGAIITWQDLRNGNWDIYAQRIDTAGAVRWIVDGVAVSTAANDQIDPIILADGSGGAIIVWEDQRSGNRDIFAQRVDSAGLPQWTANGVAIATAANDQSQPNFIGDGSGGAVIVWEDLRAGNDDVYAQRIDSAGVIQWTGDGVAVSMGTSDEGGPVLVRDGSGGAIIAWDDERSGEDDVYAQRIDAAVVLQWAVDAVPICTAAAGQDAQVIVDDGAGAAIIAWEDWRSGEPDIFAQRIDADGTVQWTTNGVTISAALNSQEEASIVSDGSGGAIITWQDLRSGAWDIYAQRIDANGVVHWPVIGIENPGPLISGAYQLFQNYPNPFNPSTAIEFSIPHTEFVTLKIYNILGEKVAILVSEKLPAGKYKYDWEAGSLASGVYIYQFKAGDFVKSRKMVFLK